MQLPQALTGAIIHELVDSVDTECLTTSDHSLIFSSNGLKIYYYYTKVQFYLKMCNHGLVTTRQIVFAEERSLM